MRQVLTHLPDSPLKRELAPRLPHGFGKPAGTALSPPLRRQRRPHGSGAASLERLLFIQRRSRGIFTPGLRTPRGRKAGSLLLARHDLGFLRREVPEAFAAQTRPRGIPRCSPSGGPARPARLQSDQQRAREHTTEGLEAVGQRGKDGPGGAGHPGSGLCSR